MEKRGEWGYEIFRGSFLPRFSRLCCCVERCQCKLKHLMLELATRTCLTNERCKSTSSTYGAPGSDEYTVHEHDSARSTRWPLTSAPTTRVFQSQTGTVEVFIYTTGILRSQSATCVCIQLPCATKV